MNTAYELEEAGKPRVLRLIHRDRRDAAAIEGEIDFVLYASVFKPLWDRAACGEFLAALLEGYREHHPIDALWVQRIWGFVRLRRLEMMMHFPDTGNPPAAWFSRNLAHFSAAEPLV